MTTGDEPQLGGQHTDNSPMISGASTRILVSARGAYIAGNLRALIDVMSEYQRNSFRRALVEQALWYVNRARILLTPEYDYVADELASWLSHQDTQRVLEQIELPSEPRLRARLHMVSRLLECLVQPVEQVSEIVRSIATHIRSHEERSDHRQSISPEAYKEGWLSERWQVEAAWAVIRGQRTPAPGDVIDDARHRAYISSDLMQLCAYLSASQLKTFRRVQVATAAKLAEYVLNAPPDNPQKWRCMELVKQWIQQPNRQIESECAALVEQNFKQARIGSGFVPSPMDVHPAVHCASAVFQTDLNRAYTDILFAITTAVTRLPNGDQWLADHPIRAWQVEVAWAILQGEDIPALEWKP